jgi:ketosteroid isomerase-like protein
MSREILEFAEFMKRREAAANAYIAGDFAPLSNLTTQAEPASFFGPGGGTEQGAAQVYATYEQGARGFGPGATGRFEILHMHASGDLAYWVGLQHATTHLKEKPGDHAFHLRITEIFRRDGGTWKLIHRHADPLAEKPAR